MAMLNHQMVTYEFHPQKRPASTFRSNLLLGAKRPNLAPGARSILRAKGQGSRIKWFNYQQWRFHSWTMESMFFLTM